MADIERAAEATWIGELRSGTGTLSTGSGILADAPFTFVTRFQQAKGTNPEELLAAAHAACFSMALSNTLHQRGYAPRRVHTEAVCHLTPERGESTITRMRLEIDGSVDGLDSATFQRIAEEVNDDCIISRVMRGNVRIEVNARLEAAS